MALQSGQPADHYARAYSSRLHPLHVFHRRRLDRISSLVPQQTKVLDAGCDAGVLASLLVDKGCQVVGVDVRAPSIKLARQQCPEAQFHVRDIRNLRLNERFDVIVCTDVLEHLMEPQRKRAVSRLLAHLEPGGLIVISYPSRLYFAAEPLWRRLRRVLYGDAGWDDDDVHIPIRSLSLPGCETLATGTVSTHHGLGRRGGTSADRQPAFAQLRCRRARYVLSGSGGMAGG